MEPGNQFQPRGLTKVDGLRTAMTLARKAACSAAALPSTGNAPAGCSAGQRPRINGTQDGHSGVTLRALTDHGERGVGEKLRLRQRPSTVCGYTNTTRKSFQPSTSDLRVKLKKAPDYSGAHSADRCSPSQPVSCRLPDQAKFSELQPGDATGQEPGHPGQPGPGTQVPGQTRHQRWFCHEDR